MRALYITPAAAKRLMKILSSESVQHRQYLRIRVDSGGCVGLQYSFDIEAQIHEDDCVYQALEHSGVAVVVDDISLGLIQGAVLDFAEDMMGALFSIKNPQATASCGCGNSFSMV